MVPVGKHPADDIKFEKENIMMKSGAKELLSSLCDHGIRLAVATSSSERMFIPCLRRHGIYSLFSSIVTAGDVGIGKSSPAIYLKAASDIGVSPSECAVFEDLPTGLESAKGAGFTCIGILDEFSRDEWDEVKALSDGAIHGFSELRSEKNSFFSISRESKPAARISFCSFFNWL